MKKVYLRMMLAVVLSLSVNVSWAEIASGTCGDNLTWSLSDDGVLTVSGSGEMTTSPWGGYYRDNIMSVMLSFGVTSIGDEAFLGCSSLTSIEIPSSVTSIGNWTFSGCSDLTSIEIPSSMTNIGYLAFEDCSGLMSIEIPSSVTSISDDAFNGCSGLTSIVVDSENPIYDSRNNCNAIIESSTNELIAGCATTIIPMSVTSIGWGAFSGCSSLTSIEIPSSVTRIGDFAFQNCSGLTSIEIPTSLTNIGSSAFYGCSSLTSIEIPSSVTSIGDGAFGDCSGLTTIEIPTSVRSIGRAAFSGCSGLTSIVVDSENPIYDSRNNCNAIIESSTNELIAGCAATIIPMSVTSIGWGAFSGCSSLTSIEIPSSVTSIDYHAFYDCSSLTSIEIPSSVTIIGGGAFYGCSSLMSIVVDSKNPIYDSRNNCNAIIKTSTNELITGCAATIIPTSVTSIGNWAFWYCSGLTSIEIPSSVTSIGYSAFEGCSGLMSIVVDSENPIYDSRNNCNAIIESSTNELIAGCAATIIPTSVTSIGGGAFSGCSGLTSIEIPSSVTSIGYCAFYDCSNLTKVRIMKETPMAYNGFFYGCDLSKCTLYVPEGSVEAYQNAAGWKDFGTIIELKHFLLGDPNNDGKINVLDLVALVNYIFENGSPDNIREAADMDGNGEINAIDYVKMVNLILNQPESNAAPVRDAEALAGSLYMAPFAMTAGEMNTAMLYLEGATADYTCLQFDLTLPVGISITEAESLSARHSLSYQPMANGSIRLLLSSSANKPILADDGIIRLTLQADNTMADGTYYLSTDNALLVTDNADTFSPENQSYPFTVSDPAGISSISLDESAAKAYNLRGQQVQFDTRQMSAGIYVIDGKKVIVE